ncbi:MAG: type I methionyl aminopeptidase [Deltaproteobacteria bacterium]|nr:type I methionyl aminopeptidase [Deltaproteobacteria bacterium]MBW1930182.1 type I methionyl aminopeptidase [Deltaproteobacteria bacterium]MBW2024925.1 type I methionyl aminopeptidase [Deltaproteobacteria bacterium]MBW2124954.1 type I methionyl aminopeptidase [Deltaproteobacteria bacterium]RLB24113.1 MAG: methionine aminopeptidase [Deltaproteobacteria bacterium]
MRGGLDLRSGKGRRKIVLREKNITKIGRNDPCPCGSGLKYKKCCLGKDNIKVNNLEEVYLRKYGIRLKRKKDIEAIKRAGIVALKTLDLVESNIRPGMATKDIDRLVYDFTIEQGAVPAPLNYKGFPKSVCVSVNEVICHGIPGDRLLQEGDIVNVDVTPILNGYYADASKTFFVGSPGEDARKIVAVAKESLKRGIAQVRPGNTIGDIGWAIQTYAEAQGCSVVREFVGHGVGFKFHEPPQVPHYGRKGEGIVLIPGMVFTVEPMINLGQRHLKILEDNWTAVTADGSLSAQFEQTILVTKDGWESLTPYEL